MADTAMKKICIIASQMAEGLFLIRPLLVLAVVGLYVVGSWWLSGMAKPMGEMPYRYGTWLGISCGLIAVIFLIVAIKQLLRVVFEGSNATSQIAGGPIAAIIFAFISVGLLRRKRFAIVLFFTFAVLVLVLQTLILVYPLAGSSNQVAPLELFLAVIFLVVTGIYFGKRWKLMVPSSAPPSPEKVPPVM